LECGDLSPLSFSSKAAFRTDSISATKRSTSSSAVWIPSDKSLGYYQMSLRDNPAARNRRGGQFFGWKPIFRGWHVPERALLVKGVLAIFWVFVSR